MFALVTGVQTCALPISGLEAAMETRQSFGDNMHEDGAAKLLEVAFRHPIKLIANALGVPPPLMLELGKRHNVPVAALVGPRNHAMAQVREGVGILHRPSLV